MRFSSVLFLTAVLLGLTGCRNLQIVGVAVSGLLTPYIPQDSTALVGIDIQKIKTSGFYRRHPDILKFGPLDSGAEKIGLDPRQNVNSVVLSWRKNSTDALLLASGSFSAELLGPRLVNMGARREVNTDRVLYATAQGSVLFPKDNVAVMGQRTAVVPTELILIRKGTGEIPEPLAARLRSLPGGAQLWAVSRNGLPLGGMSTPDENVNSALANFASYISGTAIGFELTDGVRFQSDLDCISDEGARRVQDALRGIIGLARMGTKNNQLPLLRVYDEMKITQAGKAVHLRLDLNAGLADQLLAAFPSRER